MSEDQPRRPEAESTPPDGVPSPEATGHEAPLSDAGAEEPAESPPPEDGVAAIAPTVAAAIRGEGTASLPEANDESMRLVGIGASAGGLEAILEFFAHAEPTRFTYVLVQHLSPDFKSHMADLLTHKTAMDCEEVTAPVVPRPGKVYLHGPRRQLVFEGGKLVPIDAPADQRPPMPINRLFASLAHELGERAIGVVLSGAGSDGARGVATIRAEGGLVIVQDPASAAFDGMPRSALAHANYVLLPSQMPGLLARQLLAGSVVALSEAEQMELVLGLLAEQTGIDFSLYKRDLVRRRLERRRMLEGHPTLGVYLQHLRATPPALQTFAEDLLIGVTAFFRDGAAFALLEEKVVPDLVACGQERGTLRVWVPGCATGEEAYSIGMLLLEEMERVEADLHLRIFATDVHEEALRRAAAGLFDAEQLSSLSPERRRRWFRQVTTRFKVLPDLRRVLVFSRHDLIRNPPLSSMDMVSCRNLLIYFRQVGQERAVALLHQALNVGGTLLLGPSESLGRLEKEFETIDRNHCVYRKTRDVRLVAGMAAPDSVFVGPTVVPRSTTLQPKGLPPDLVSAYDALLARFMPAALLFNDEGALVHVFGAAAGYLVHEVGRVSMDALRVVHKDLRAPLRGALNRTKDAEIPTSEEICNVDIEGSVQRVRLSVHPLPEVVSGSRYFVVTIEPVEDEVVSTEAHRVEENHAHSAVVRREIDILQRDLERVRQERDVLVHKLESSNEQLQSTNEELIASNEELQSTNEELQSANEELYSVNLEHRKRIEDLQQLTDDMNNLLDNSEVGIVFVDRELRIRRFSDSAARLLDLRPQDEGRPIDLITYRIKELEEQDYGAVMDEGQRVEIEVTVSEGKTHLLRFTPYRRQGEEVAGMVLTLIDITRSQ